MIKSELAAVLVALMTVTETLCAPHTSSMVCMQASCTLILQPSGLVGQ